MVGLMLQYLNALETDDLYKFRSVHTSIHKALLGLEFAESYPVECFENILDDKSN